MKVFYNPDCLLHNPPHEILSGKLVPYLESPDRLTRIKHVLESKGFQVLQPIDRSDPKWPLEHVFKVHDPDYIRYLETIYEQWVEESAVLPETFLHPKLSPSIPRDTSALSSIARAGLHCFDLSSPITSETYRSVLASVSVTLSAAEELMLRMPDGIFALARPPGHHAGTSIYGGYCFLNNAAIAARFLQSATPATTVAILDIDYHHGNGTQQIFYADPSVLYVSLHADGDYPYFTGAATERGSGAGRGPRSISLSRNTHHRRNVLCRARGGRPARACVRPHIPGLSLGVDTYAEDPICEFRLTQECYARMGALVAGIARPTLFVMEGCVCTAATVCLVWAGADCVAGDTIWKRSARTSRECCADSREHCTKSRGCIMAQCEFYLGLLLKQLGQVWASAMVGVLRAPVGSGRGAWQEEFCASTCRKE
ncbi:hypothetical protein B0H21DRAFT_876236 [Amylocystis lapponica]|nr:hypothetical protein B0H21DRAFT_876236 [Amylocystis lapponica]